MGGFDAVERRRTIVDASVLINFIGLGRLDLLTGLKHREILVTATVNMQVQRSRVALDAAISDGQIAVVDPPLEADAEVFARLTRRIGVADASCVVAAKVLDADLAADDTVFLSSAAQVISTDRVLGTEALLAEGVVAGLLTLAEGDDLLGQLTGIKYRPKVASLWEMIREPNSP